MIKEIITHVSMNIHLSDNDIALMPESLRKLFIDWLPQFLKNKGLQPKDGFFDKQSSKLKVSSTQLVLNLDSQVCKEHIESSHVTLTELFDAGILKRGMAIRIKLKRKVANKLNRDYINGLEISTKGTIFYEGQEFSKPSPLAAKINASATNGWEYIEVKKNGLWICLDELRKTWRHRNA